MQPLVQGKASTSRLERTTLYHSLLLIFGSQLGPNIYQIWKNVAEALSFLPFHENGWSKNPFSGWPDHDIIQKLKSLKLALKEWISSTFGVIPN